VRFVDAVPRPIRIALIAFSDEPTVITPPTADRGRLLDDLAHLAAGFGTAIGDAIARGVEVARTSTGEVEGALSESSSPTAGEPPPSAVVLLSDGSQTRGLLTPEDGARMARRAGVPVHTIALGTLDGVVSVFRGGDAITVPVPPDRETLAGIAESTGGQTYEVTDAPRLGEVYERLGSVVGRVRKPREVTVAFVGAGAALLAAATLLAGLWAPRLP
jgi:Ca-activated chloride channel family protein